MESYNEKALDEIRASVPSVCTISDHHISLNSVCAMRMQNLKTHALNIAMKHTDQLLASMDLSKNKKYMTGWKIT